MVKRLAFLIAALLFSGACVYHDADVTSSQCSTSDLALVISATTDASSCTAADGSITVAASGGIESYTFQMDDGTYQESGTFTGLASGSYTISLKDGNGCIVSDIVSVNNAQSMFTIDVSTIANTGCPTANGTLTVSVTGGTAPFQYKINSGAYQTSNVFSSLSAGAYSVTVMDVSGCPVSGSGTVARSGPSYSAAISTIINTKCAISGCHNGSRSPNLSTYAGVSANASRVQSEVTSKSMPPSNSSAGSLTTEQINLISCWVADGALNN